MGRKTEAQQAKWTIAGEAIGRHDLIMRDGCSLRGLMIHALIDVSDWSIQPQHDVDVSGNPFPGAHFILRASSSSWPLIGLAARCSAPVDRQSGGGHLLVGKAIAEHLLVANLAVGKPARR